MMFNPLKQPTKRQGAATAYVRKEKVHICATATAKGWRDGEGLWRGLLIDDPTTFSELLDLSVEDDRLGQVVMDALNQSRVIPQPRGTPRESVQALNLALAQSFGLKSASNLYGGMKCVNVHWLGETTTLTPTRHVRASDFQGFSENQSGHERIVVRFDADASAFGIALRECVARCL